MSVSAVPQSPQALVAQWMKQLGDVAGTEAGKAAGELLNQILESNFESPSQMSHATINQRFPSPLSQFALQLKALGVTSQTIGEVMNELSHLIPSRGLKNLQEALEDDEHPLGDEDEEDASAMGEAAKLMGKLLKAADDARQNAFGRIR